MIWQFWLHFIVFIWGFTGALGKLISLPADVLVWYRMLIASVFIFGYIKFLKKPIWVSRKDLILLIGTGAIIAGHWITFFHAIKVSNISITLVTLSANALFTSILEPIFFKRKFQAYEGILGLVSILALYLIFRAETNYIEGILWALLSALLSATFGVINGRFVQRIESYNISFYEMSGGFIFVGIFLLATGSMNAEYLKLSWEDFCYLLLLGSVCTAFAFVMSVYIMNYLTPYTVALTINLEPVWGIIIALLIFGADEKMSLPFYLGGATLIATVLANNYFKKKAKKRLTNA